MDTNTKKVTEKPLVSVCMITYNRSSFLPEAIESVQRQTYSNWEMVIVDDASTDNTKEVVALYANNDERIKYFCNKDHKKISESRNRSLEHSQGEYIAILDSDDVWSDSHKLEKQVSFFQEHAEHVLVGSGVVVIDEHGKEKKQYLNPQIDKSIRREMYRRNPFAHSSVMYKKSIAEEVGRYDTSLDTAEDYDLFLRFGKKGKMANISEYLIQYRVHGSNITITDRLQTMQYNIELIKKYRGLYPGYLGALAWRWVRTFIYRILKFLHWV